MLSVSTEFWAEVDQRVAHACSGSAEPSPLLRPSLAPERDQDGSRSEPGREPAAHLDWDHLLDMVNEARALAEAHKAHMLAQEEAFQRALQEVRQETATIWQQVCLVEAQAREDRAVMERQASWILAQAEEYIRKQEAGRTHQVVAQRREERERAESRHQRLEAALVTLNPRRERPLLQRAA